MIRIERLDDRLARLLATSGAAGDLRQQLERPLAARKSAMPSPTSAETTPTSVTRGKVVALGDHLRADEDVDRAVAEARAADASIAPWRRTVSRSTLRDAHTGNTASDLLLDPLGAEAGLLHDTRAAHSGHVAGAAAA